MTLFLAGVVWLELRPARAEDRALPAAQPTMSS
jgi:hypothetical protein